MLLRNPRTNHKMVISNSTAINCLLISALCGKRRRHQNETRANPIRREDKISHQLKKNRDRFFTRTTNWIIHLLFPKLIIKCLEPFGDIIQFTLGVLQKNRVTKKKRLKFCVAFCLLRIANDGYDGDLVETYTVAHIQLRIFCCLRSDWLHTSPLSLTLVFLPLRLSRV